MKLSRPDADVFVPAGGKPAAALARVTHLCVAAHQDDIEIMAHAGICDCLDRPESRAFGGVVVTDGAGSPRIGPYAGRTDAQMKLIRRDEQRRAAEIGGYAIQLQLAHPSRAIKQPGNPDIAADLTAVFAGSAAEVVFLHNPMDKHDTHIAVLLRCLEALRALPANRQPRQVLGAEVWRGLDWMTDTDKVVLDSGRRPQLGTRLLEVFDSQIFGGKRYDLATEGRRAANATFHDSHASDSLRGITWAMDLTPLVRDPTADLADYAAAYVDRLRADIVERIGRFR